MSQGGPSPWSSSSSQTASSQTEKPARTTTSGAFTRAPIRCRLFGSAASWTGSRADAPDLQMSIPCVADAAAGMGVVGAAVDAGVLPCANGCPAAPSAAARG
eukprot:2111317-Pyramimonas_sp.AAC.1